jgi:hypothetical protein
MGNENPNVGVQGGALDANTKATTPDAAGPPIDHASREELAQSGYRLPEHFFGEKAAAGAPANKSVTPGTQNKTLDDVRFASGAASSAAADAGLTHADFNGVVQSSDNGYTKADVEGIVAAKNV